MRLVYLALAGLVLPLSQLLPWILAHGLDLPLLVHELFATRPGAFFALDVLVSSVVLFVFIAHEGRARAVRALWLPVLATCLVGVSCGFPLFLYLRERSAARGLSAARAAPMMRAEDR